MDAGPVRHGVGIAAPDALDRAVGRQQPRVVAGEMRRPLLQEPAGRRRAAPRGCGVTSRRLARLATVGRDGTPHVVPTGFRYDPDDDAIVIGGIRMAETKKFRDLRRSGRAALVVAVIRIHPERVRSWGLGG